MERKETTLAEEHEFIQKILGPVKSRRSVSPEVSEAFSGSVKRMRRAIPVHVVVVGLLLAVAIEHLVQYGKQGATWDIVSGILFSILAVTHAVTQALNLSRQHYRIKIIEAFLVKGTSEELAEFLEENRTVA